MNAILRIVTQFLRWIVARVSNVPSPPVPIPLPTTPQISSFFPAEGWPGTIITIQGARFGPNRDDNTVQVGGDRALVLQASLTELIVMAGEATVSGPVEVTTSTGSATSAQPFKILPWPAEDDVSQAGPPLFFHGPQHGTPRLGVPDQPVLVVFTYPTDHDPGSAPARATLRNNEITAFNNARRFWQEASYGSTSWAFTFTDWIALPHERNFYMWQADDVFETRRALLRMTKRGAAVRGNEVYAGNRADGLNIVNVNNPSSPNQVSGVTLGERATAVRIVSNRAFVTAGSAGLYIFDINASPPTQLSRRTTTGWFHDVDVSGNLAVVAALEEGVRIYDVGIPGNPTLLTTFSFGGGWATAVRLVGNRAYIGVDDTLRVLDLTTPATPSLLANVPTSAFVMALDIEGTLCAVATDGQGLRLFDISGVIPAARSPVLTVNRLHGVDLAGSRAYVSAADAGLHIYDVSNTMAPAPLGSLATASAAYHTVVSGNLAHVLLGGRNLTVIDVSNPASPTVRGSVVLGFSMSPSIPLDPDLPTLRNNLRIAIDSQNFTQRHGTLMIDALQGAQGVGFNLDNFEGIVVVVNGPFLRGASGTADQFNDEGRTLRLNNRKGIYYVATGAHWGRIAHETGHWLGMWDIYQEWFSDGTLLAGTAAPWCLSGDSDSGPLFCAHQIQEIMHFYNMTGPNVNMVERTWSPTAPPMNETFDIVAHDVAQDGDPNRVHIVKLVVATGLIYFIEVRQKPTGLIFDQSIAVANPVQGAVVVTRATQGTTISNTFERPIMLFGQLDVGQQVVDAARGLTIHVDSIVQNRPLVYRVRVQWNQPVIGDPNGQFDMTITPWSTQTWETVDMWIDSPRNNGGGPAIYENHEPMQPTVPRLNGDRPWVRRANKIFARVRNTGPVAVNDVYVSFYVTSPPGIGDNGNWATLNSQHIPTLPGRDPAVPGSGEMIIEQEWRPDADKHTCLKVAIMPQNGEIEPNNNLAQENVASFDSAGGSSHDPVILEAEVRSPFSIWRKVDLRVFDLPLGWHVVVNHAWVWTEPKGAQPVSAVIWTDLNAPYSFTPGYIWKLIHDQEHVVPAEALPRVEGWTTFDHRYLPIGGILADVKAKQRVRLDCNIAVDGNVLIANGCLKPPIAGVLVTLEIIDESNRAQYVYLTTNSNGCFDIVDLMKQGQPRFRLPPGVYLVQVFVAAGTDAAETECLPVRVEVKKD